MSCEFYSKFINTLFFMLSSQFLDKFLQLSWQDFTTGLPLPMMGLRSPSWLCAEGGTRTHSLPDHHIKLAFLQCNRVHYFSKLIQIF